MLAQGLVHWRGTGTLARPQITPAARRTHRNYAVRSSLGTLFLAVQNRWDLLVVGAVLAAADAGVYAVLLSLSSASDQQK